MQRLISSILLTGVLVAATGCGGGLKSVSGTVTLEGKAVSGATVVFTSADGKVSASGMTDASGNFTLSTAGKPGAPAGEYKVTVTKTAVIEGQAGTPGSAEYMKQMQKSMPKAGVGGGPPVSSGPTGPVSSLPVKYAAISSTPLTVKVPADGPVKLELKANP